MRSSATQTTIPAIPRRRLPAATAPDVRVPAAREALQESLDRRDNGGETGH